MPFLLFAGLGLVIMFLANAYLLSREYFLLAAMRFRPPDEAKAMRRAHRASVFLAGLLIAMFVSIPIVNLATPLFAMAMMVHMHKRLSAPRRVQRARSDDLGLSVSWPRIPSGHEPARPSLRGHARLRAPDKPGDDSLAYSTVLPGHLHRSAITHFSHSGRRARQV